MTLNRIFQVAFGTTGAASVIFIVFGLIFGRSGPTPLPPPKPLPAIALHPAKPFQLKPLKDYAAISERPLFSPTRRPLRTPILVKGSGRGPAGDIVLTGVVITGDGRYALIKMSKSGVEQRLREGETVRGWQVDKIFFDRVVLRGEGKTAVIPIWNAAKAKFAKSRQNKRDISRSADRPARRDGSAKKKRSQP